MLKVWTIYLVRDGIEGDDHVAVDRRHLLTPGVIGYTSNGIIGTPSLAPADKGKAFLDSLSASAATRLAVINKVRSTRV